MADPKKKGGPRTKRARKHVEAEGVAHIKATFNNTLVTITDNNGKGAAFIVYSAALGDRARARGARYGRELYVVAGAFLVSFGLIEIVRVVLF